MEQIISKLKEEDKLFEYLFQRVFYGGSYYDGLKIEKPEEYDLDLLLSLPKLVNATVTASKLAGFVKVQLRGIEILKRHTAMLNIYRYTNLKYQL